MNEKRRAKLRKAAKLLDEAAEIVSEVYDEESDCLCNIPENLQNSMIYERIDESVDILGETIDDLDEVMDKVQGLVI